MVRALPRPGGRRAVFLGTVVCALLGLLAWGVVTLDGEDSVSGHITIATGVPAGVYHLYGELLQQDLAHDQPDLRVRLTPSEGGPDNLSKLATGKAAFTFATADAVQQYQSSDAPGARHLRACARLYDDYMQLVVARDSKVRSAADLRGLRVGVGAKGSGVQIISRRLLEAAGLRYGQDVKPVEVSLIDMRDRLRDGRLDAFFWSGGLPTSALTDLADTFPIRLVPLGDLVAPLHRQEESVYYRSAVMPADAYPAVQGGQAVKTVAVANLLVTTDRTDPRLTEAVTRTVIDSRDRIGKKVHAAQKVDLRTAVFTDPLPLHVGARRYYVSTKP
ncbi:TAXI family TRAP transporter solute-binding subunit [Streptomyces sp. NPDC059740]|uniref:TAXI family TRAP transporter solute-binding subunit n=1 Tax=Streptomyces sp. NPDC059740 TaxID=3346926 RepID=UPI0036566183